MGSAGSHAQPGPIPVHRKMELCDWPGGVTCSPDAGRRTAIDSASESTCVSARVVYVEWCVCSVHVACACGLCLVRVVCGHVYVHVVCVYA